MRSKWECCSREKIISLPIDEQVRHDPESTHLDIWFLKRNTFLSKRGAEVSTFFYQKSTITNVILSIDTRTIYKNKKYIFLREVT